MFFGCLGFVISLYIFWILHSKFALLPECKEEFEENIKQTNILIENRRAEAVGIGKLVSIKTIESDEVSCKKPNKNKGDTQTTIPSTPVLNLESAHHLAEGNYL